MTLHGTNTGLDEIEAFDSEMAGLIEGITSGDYPASLEKISIVEVEEKRAELLEKNDLSRRSVDAGSRTSAG